MRCELVSLLSQDLESGLFCCQVPKRLLAMCLEFTALKLWFFGTSFCVLSGSGAGLFHRLFHRWELGGTQPAHLGCCCILGSSWGAQECPLTPAKHCKLCFLGHSGIFGLPLPALMDAAMCTLIFMLFLSSILLCATWSAATCPARCELRWDMVPQNGENPSRVPSLPTHLQSCAGRRMASSSLCLRELVLMSIMCSVPIVRGVEMSPEHGLKRFREFMDSAHPQWT